MQNLNPPGRADVLNTRGFKKPQIPWDKTKSHRDIEHFIIFLKNFIIF